MIKHAWLIFLIGLLSCVSREKLTEPIALPMDLEKYFRSCSTLDGAINMRVYEDKDYKGATDAEWTADAESFQLQMQDPVARTLFHIKLSRTEQDAAMSGPLAAEMPTVQVRDGFINIDGYFVGLRPEELGCYLAGYIPFNQTRNIRALTRNGQGYVLNIEDANRAIEVDIQSEDPSETKICSRISWSAVLGLVKRAMLICTRQMPAQSGQVSLLDRYSLQWETLE